MRLASRKQRTFTREDWPSDRQILLHVGCGPRAPGMLPAELSTPDWLEVRLDIDPAVQPDIVGSIVEMQMVGDESVDAIWSSHNLEHVFAHEVPSVLAEFWRVLRPGGTAHIQVPDAMAPAKAIMKGQLEGVLYESPAGPVTALDMLFGFGPAIERGQHYMAHKTAFTRETLQRKLVAASFADVKVTAPGDRALWATGRRRGTPAQR